MRAHRFLAASTLGLVCCATLAVAQNTRGTQSAPALQSGTPVEIPLATASRIGRAKNSWWPTKNPQAPEDFVGNKVCATCHAEKTASQIATPMARAASRVSSAKVLQDHPSMTATRGKFFYAISQTAEGFDYSVSEGANRISATLLWAFGIANKGQTYIYEKGGEFYESEMSYYSAIAGLDVTTGHEQNARSPARTLLVHGRIRRPRKSALPVIAPEPPRSAAGSLRKTPRLVLPVKPAMGRVVRMSS
jgi:hypothetical protein